VSKHEEGKEDEFNFNFGDGAGGGGGNKGNAAP